jgi:hypothetical protein
VKRYTMPLQTTLGLAQAATRPPRRNTAPRRVLGLLRRWRERAYLRRQLFGSAHEVSDGTGPPDLEVKARLAAADCPELAISIVEESGG